MVELIDVEITLEQVSSLTGGPVLLVRRWDLLDDVSSLVAGDPD